MKKKVAYTVAVIISVVNKIINLLITVAAAAAAAAAAFSSYEKTSLYPYFLVVPNLFQFNNILFLFVSATFCIPSYQKATDWLSLSSSSLLLLR